MTVLLQLRTYAAGGTKKGLVYLFVACDILMLGGLIAMAVVRKINPSTFSLTATLYQTGQDGNNSYDPYLWRSIVPLEIVTLLVNVKLTWSAFRRHGTEKNYTSQLMKTILRDNVFYLLA